MLISIVGEGSAQTSSFDPRTVKLKSALARPMARGGLRITVVLREPEESFTRAERPNRVRNRQGRVLARLNRGKFKLHHRYRWLNGFSGWADAETIELLKNDPHVLSVDVDRVAHMALAQGSAIVGATTAQGLGLTGDGVTVAVLDTGIDTDHPDLSGSVIAEECFCDDAPGVNGCCPGGGDTQSGTGAAEDDEGHGTATSGVIVSSNVTNKGVAPDADIVAIKVLAANGSGTFSDVADALDWIITNHAIYGIKLVNISLSDGGQYNNAAVAPCTGSNTANAIAQLKTLGVTVFAASGNDGFDAGISFPACSPDAISVGGTYDVTFSQVGWCGATCATILCTDMPATVDTFVCHTNSGALLDLLAPDFRTTVPQMGGGSANFGGTSIASPYAAGQAALLLEAKPTLTPDEIEIWLTAGAPMVTNSDNGLSFPRTRVDLAAQALLAVCGNGVLEVNEDCDDGNTVGGDCCDAVCDFEILGSVCDDSDMCTVTDTCDGAGLCVGSGALGCDDSNVCTDDSCIPATGCDYVDNTDPCDDLDACTSGDICAAGACNSGGPITCDDSNICTDDSCIPATGCDFAPNTDPCDDVNACTTGEVCAGGVCTSGAPVTCDDSNVCTDDSCIPASGCDFDPNTDLCDDLDACTNGDVCAGGTCTSGSLITCDDTNACTDDSCIPASGCDFAPNTDPCDDSDACTTGEVCAGGVCSSGSSITCDDTNVCTDDSCIPATGCDFAPNTDPCDDLDACTDSDVCSAGACVPGTALDCDDFDECTADGCDEITGCSHAPIEGCPVFVPSFELRGLLLLTGCLVGVAFGALRNRGSRSAAR